MLERKQIKWQWEVEQEQAFQLLKQCLLSELETNASKIALGACLFQEQDGIAKPIAYASKILNSTERNYATVEREALAFYWAYSLHRSQTISYTIK
jgi:hypothetical protein